MIIRPESASDYDAIRGILLAAFANHPYSHQTEHLIVEALRAAGAMTVALVAEVDGQVVGHIAFSPVLIGGRRLPVVRLGPVAVLPACSGKASAALWSVPAWRRFAHWRPGLRVGGRSGVLHTLGFSPRTRADDARRPAAVSVVPADGRTGSTGRSGTPRGVLGE